MDELTLLPRHPSSDMRFEGKGMELRQGMAVTDNRLAKEPRATTPRRMVVEMQRPLATQADWRHFSLGPVLEVDSKGFSLHWKVAKEKRKPRQ